MSAYVIFDVEIRDMARYQDFMKGVKPALDAAGRRCGTCAAARGWCPSRVSRPKTEMSIEASCAN